MKLGVSGIVIRDDKVLLVRHTYGPAKGKLLIPGGIVEPNELADDAIVREINEETGVETIVCSLAGTRLRPDDVWLIFLMRYVKGEPVSDNAENDLATFAAMDFATTSSEVTESTRFLLNQFLTDDPGVLGRAHYVPEGYDAHGYRFYAGK